MQVAASNPLVVSREELDSGMIEKEREIYREKMLAEGKPENMVDKIVDGMLEKRYYKDVCLLEQDFIKDTEMTVQDYINTFIAKLGENIQVRRFTRYSLGE
jgi:elongation factor Ts